MDYICKPARVSIYINSKKLTPAQIKKETGCDALVNGGGSTQGISPGGAVTSSRIVQNYICVT